MLDIGCGNAHMPQELDFFQAIAVLKAQSFLWVPNFAEKAITACGGVANNKARVAAAVLAATGGTAAALHCSASRSTAATLASAAACIPAELDLATTLAGFPPAVRKEVVLTANEDMRAQLPPAVLAEAQVPPGFPCCDSSMPGLTVIRTKELLLCCSSFPVTLFLCEVAMQEYCIISPGCRSLTPSPACQTTLSNSFPNNEGWCDS